MIAIRHNITVVIQDGKKREYFNVMLQHKELLERVGEKVFQILVFAEGSWIDEKGNIQ